MTVAELIDEEVMQRIALRGCISGIDPYALHLLKTSDHPILRFRRDWMRREALRQCLEATKQQKKNNATLANQPVPRGTSMRQFAEVDPYFVEDMRRRHKASWNDKDFLGYVKREEPEMFPKR